MSELRVGINGFGRIGRLVFRAGFKKMNIVGVNNLSSPDLSAHLLKYDSVHGVFEEEVTSFQDKLQVGGRDVFFSSFEDPSDIPWDEWGVDLVLECTGFFQKREEVLKHLTPFSQARHTKKKAREFLKDKDKDKNQGSFPSGKQRKVLVSAPFKEADKTFVFGVNHQDYRSDEHHIVSNASCTTNCLAPMIRVLDHHFGVEWGLMTTIHSYTNDQKLLDASHKDLRRARAAALSMIPTSTGATQAVSQVLPHLKGRLKGMAVRVPTPNVSLVDFVFSSKNSLNVKDIHKAFEQEEETSLKGVLKCEPLPLVSSDFMTTSYSCVVDAPSTMVLGSHVAKIISWYDNEMGFSHRMVDMALHMHQSQ